MLRTSPRDLTFDLDYREEVILPNGRRVRLRTIRPSDKEHLQKGIKRLSPEAVFARFFSVKRHLTRQELEYLTEIDGIRHYALGAVLLNDDGSEGEGVAVGRFVRDPQNPDSAEPAVVVLDEWQSQGLGRMIFERLVAAARERGIRYFHVEFLHGNEAMQRLLEGLCPELMIWRRGEVLVADVPLPDVKGVPCQQSSESIFSTLLRLAAQKLIQVRLRGPDGGE